MRLTFLMLGIFLSTMSLYAKEIAPQDTIWKKKKNGDRYFEIYNGEIDSLPKRKAIPYIGLGLNTWMGDKPEQYKLRALSSRYLELGFSQRFKVGEGALGIQIGIEGLWNNYRWDDDDNYLVALPDGHSFESNGHKLSRNKLTTITLGVPILLQHQYRQENTYTWQWAAGLYAGYVLSSFSKIKYKDKDGKKQKNKSNEDFKVRQLRYGLMGLVGYKQVSLVVKYDLNPFFENQKTLPKVQTLSIGLRVQP